MYNYTEAKREGESLSVARNCCGTLICASAFANRKTIPILADYAVSVQAIGLRDLR